MLPRKNGSAYNLSDENGPKRPNELTPAERINDEDDLDTRDISHSVEEGDEDYDDEQLEDDELTEADFAGEEEEFDDEDIL